MAENGRNKPLLPFNRERNCHMQNTLNVTVWYLNSRFRHNIHYFRLSTYMLYQKNLDWVVVIEIFLKMAKKSYLPQKVRRLIRQRSKYMCSLYCGTKSWYETPVCPSVCWKLPERCCFCPTRPLVSCSRNKMAENGRNAPLIPFNWAKNCLRQNTRNVTVWHLNSRFRHNIHYFWLSTYMLYQKNLDWVAVIGIF